MNNSVQGAASAAIIRIIRLTAAQEDELRFLLNRHSGGRNNVGPFQPRTIRARTCDEARKTSIELVRLIKDQGPLTKRIHLKDGRVANDSKDCRMSRGIMERLCLADWRDFAGLIEQTPRNVAYALGRLRDDLPASVRLVVKDELTPGATDAAARPAENIEREVAGKID
jgi:hypothetical protein